MKRIVMLSVVAFSMFACVGGVVAQTAAERFREKHPYINIEDFVAKLDADRSLLAEVRKEVPEQPEEAQMYLARLKELAARSDPVRLVPLMNRVMTQAPIYFEWVEREFDSPDERVTEYYVGGARGFHHAIENFKSAALLNVINRLEIASRLVQELDPEAFQ